jgi:parallel beta-helix repeat protein
MQASGTLREATREAWTALIALVALGAGGTGPAPGPSQTLDLRQVAALLEKRGLLRLSPGEHQAPAPADRALFLIENRRGVEIDLAGVHLLGAAPGSDPDRARGIALEIRGCEQVVVRGGRLSGYRIGVLVRDSREVRIEGLEVESGYAPRLASGPRRPEETDRLELALGSAEAWLEGGAAIAVVDSSAVRIRGARARRAQSGVLLLGSIDCEVSDGDFSYLSGWGIALWRSDGCRLARNRLDACLRGPLEGPHADGLGSAGLLLAGGSSRNQVVFNRALGGGAGAIAAAGASGGGEENHWYGNLLSATNGPGLALTGESRPRVEANRVVGARGAGITLKGASGGLLLGNRIQGVRGAAVVLEDVRDGQIARNELLGADRGIELLARAGSPAYGAARLAILENRFQDNVLDLVLDGVGPVEVADNQVAGSSGGLDLSGMERLDGSELAPREVWARLLGPSGPQATGRVSGASLRAASPATRARLRELCLEHPPEARGPADADWQAAPEPGPLRLEAFGPHDPESSRAFRPPPGPGGLLAGRGFEASWFSFDEASDPRRDLEAWRARRFDPLARGRLQAFADPWGGAERREQVGSARFGLIAQGWIELERATTCRLDALFDDGLRVEVDGVVVLEEWSWNPARREAVLLELEAGRHEVRVEYFQLDGAAELELSLDPLPGGAASGPSGTGKPGLPGDSPTAGR